MLHSKRRLSWRRSLLLLAAAMLVITMAAACGKGKSNDGALPGADEGTAVATYDGGKVTDKEFDKYVTLVGLTNPQAALYMSIPQFKEQYLKQYVFSKMMYPQATEDDKKTAATSADEFESQLTEALKTQTELKAEMDKSKLTTKEVHSLVQYLTASAAVINRKSDELNQAVTDDERKAEFDKDPTQFNTATVRHILIMTTDPSTGEEKHTAEEALKLAKEAKAELDKSGDWDAVAKKYSEDTGSKDNGGLYENAQINGWVSGFKDAASTQEIGKIGEPVESEYGYHVIKVEKRDEPTFDKLSEENKTTLTESIGSTKLNTFMEDEQKKVNLKITLPQETTDAPADNSGTNTGTDEGANTGTDAGTNTGTDNTATNDDAAVNTGTE